MRLTYLCLISCTALALSAQALAADPSFGYKGVALGASEKLFKKKHKDASCFTNPSDNTRECVIRNTTYMNLAVDEVRAVFPSDKLGQIKITFADSSRDYNPDISTDANAAVAAMVSLACGGEAYTLEKSYGPYHKTYEMRRGQGTGVWKYWYGANGALTHFHEKNMQDNSLNTICTSSITMEITDFNKLKEKARYGKLATDDM